MATLKYIETFGDTNGVPLSSVGWTSSGGTWGIGTTSGRICLGGSVLNNSATATSETFSIRGGTNIYITFYENIQPVLSTVNHIKLQYNIDSAGWVDAYTKSNTTSSQNWTLRTATINATGNNIQLRMEISDTGGAISYTAYIDDLSLWGDFMSIQDTPQQYEPVHNDLPFVVSGSNNTQSNYKYWCDVYFSGSTTYDYRLFTFPRPDGFGFFNLRPIIRDYVVGDLSIPTTEGFNRVSDIYKSYSVHFGESYGSATGSVTSGLVSSGTYYAFDGSLEWSEFLDYSQNDRLVRVTVGGAKLLTNKNSNVATDFTNYNLIGDSENEWLFMMIKDPLAVSTANIEVFNSSQGSIGSFTVTNPYSGLTSEGDRFLMFPCGTNNLNNIDSGSVTVNSGALPIIDSDVVYYNISFGGVSTITREYMFKVETNCEKFNAYRLQYKNKWGGYDGFTFTLKNREFGNIERKQYKKQYGGISSTGDWSYDKSDRGIVSYSTKSKRRLSLVSNWITESEYENLIELIESPKVFWDNASELHAVNILNTDYEVKIYKNEKLINLEIEVEFTQMNRRQ